MSLGKWVYNNQENWQTHRIVRQQRLHDLHLLAGQPTRHLRELVLAALRVVRFHTGLCDTHGAMSVLSIK